MKLKMQEKNTCEKIEVPKNCCYIRFERGIVVSSEHLRHDTIREETVIIDYDKNGKILGIELVNPAIKRCQRG